MATQKQIDANRENAKLSTGPKTPEVKQIVSGDRVRHGIHRNYSPWIRLFNTR